MKKFLPLLGAFLSLFILGSFLHAKIPGESGREQGSPHVFRLRFQEIGFRLNLSVPLEGRDIIFKKEPDFGGRQIIRGALPAGREEEEFLCFAWDVSELKLYLDLNRNLDLTDDPSGVYRGRGKKFQQSFSRVRFESTSSQVPLLYHVTVRFSQSSLIGTPLRCLVTVHSGWLSDIELYGKKWQMAVMDNLDGIIGPEDILTLRPYKEGQEEPIGFHGFDYLDPPQKIFIGGHDHDLAFGFESSAEGSQLVATFRESQTSLSTLEINGRSIERLTLKEGKDKDSSVVLLDFPGNKVSVPAREYNKQRIFLDGGEMYAVLYADSQKKISVIQDKVTPLKLGIPLTHTVDMSRRGTELILDYQLVGAGGEKYNQIGRDFKNPPKYVIYHGENEIASGSFEYG